MAGRNRGEGDQARVCDERRGDPGRGLLARFLDGKGRRPRTRSGSWSGATGRESWGSAGISSTGSTTPRMRSRRPSWPWRGTGPSIRDRCALGGWLQEVAYRTSLKTRARRSRRQTVERQVMTISRLGMSRTTRSSAPPWTSSGRSCTRRSPGLPDKYRIPVVLSYLEGKTNEEVAELLHWPVGTVKGRLSRGRALLRSRLMRRGVAWLVGLPDGGLVPVPGRRRRGPAGIAGGRRATGDRAGAGGGGPTGSPDAVRSARLRDTVRHAPGSAASELAP